MLVDVSDVTTVQSSGFSSLTLVFSFDFPNVRFSLCTNPSFFGESIVVEARSSFLLADAEISELVDTRASVSKLALVTSEEDEAIGCEVCDSASQRSCRS